MRKIFVSTIVILTISITAFSQSTNYEVYALKYANVGVTLPLSVLVLDAPESETIDAVFMFWLLKGTNGKNILVDAGFLNDIEQSKAYSVTNYIRPDLMLPRIGLNAEDITDIILTHPHWDHMDGVDLFPNANVWIQKTDYNYFVGDAWQKDGWGDFNKRDVLKLVELNLSGKLMLIDGDDKEILPNIKVYTGSRHTFNSQFILVDNGVNKIILASDNVYTYYNLNHLMSAPKTETFDTNAYVKSMERMKTLVSDIKFIIPGHDALLFLNFPSIADDIYKID
ncbi:N-acyl homoserine lactonase family protein [Arenibacter sp. N53]|uniref:N-acyl homoserine lactonase family protein n=1 Tax=Arenibacter TaxID=178469 RepID=UPI000CD45B8D|nr:MULTISPECIES: N-acyl homoserine lactonase family protein [Arenibacter]MCM4151709.1 N-acyl homoserine lactonase family protein [Arenibacter sp. N53]